MAQSSITGRTIAIAIITVNAVISVVLIMAVVYLFFQVTHLQDENKNLRTKWQKLQVTHQGDTEQDEVNNIFHTAKVNLAKVLFCKIEVAFTNTLHRSVKITIRN